jgi:hypothetical protein
MGHPDFRVEGRIFATLGYPSADSGMVKLTPDQQEAFCAAEPSAFTPVKGGWGRGGATTVNLRHARLPSLRRALAMARDNVVEKGRARAPRGKRGQARRS